jgi:hypothetical protein
MLIGLALLMGFVADRTNLCTVSAVAEILTERRARVLWNIAKIVLWILGIVLLMDYLFGISPLNRNRFHFTWVTLLGGVIFGIGAVLNGGCSLQMFTRLGRGNLGTALSIAGLPLGAVLARPLLEQAPVMMPQRDSGPLMLDGPWRDILLVALSAWMLWELVSVLRGFRLQEVHRRLLAPDYQPASSAALLGIANGALFSLVGTWMFTYTLIQGLTNLAYPDTELYRPVPTLLWYLLAAYLAGVIGSAIHSRHALLQARPEPLWIRYFFGGVLMGLGASLVPGGNDMLLLNGIPGLSAHAVPAYLAMLVGIAMGLMVMMRLFPAEDNC